MKKIFVLCLFLSVFAISISGCQKKTSSSAPVSSQTTSSTESVVSSSVESSSVEQSSSTEPSSSAEPSSSIEPSSSVSSIKGLSAANPIFSGSTNGANLEIYVLEMNYLYGDSLFIKMGDVDILIDGGWAYDGTFVRDFVDSKVTDDKIELLMASHSDGDHIGGIPTALTNIDSVDLIIDFGDVTTTSTTYVNYKTCRDSYIDGGAMYCAAWDCIKGTYEYSSTKYYLTNDFTIEVLDTGSYVQPNSSTSAGNDHSVATIFTYKDFSFYTAGDLTTSGEAVLVNKNQVREVTLAKASHHGSNGSNSKTLFDVLKPKMIAISAARAGRYNYTGEITAADLNTNLQATSGHPYADAIGRMYASEYISINKNVFWNMYAGTMCFTTDGSQELPTFSGSVTNRGYFDKESGEKITGEENLRLSDTKVFQYRSYGFDELGNFTHL